MSLTAAIDGLQTTATTEVIDGDSKLPQSWSLPRLTHAEFDRIGQDLQITDDNGESLIVSDYFASDNHPDLILAEGATFRADWVDRLSTTSDQVAQTSEENTTVIGSVKNVEGQVTVERADGSKDTLQAGDEIYQDDVIETGSAGSIGVVFADGSNFSLGASGKMILDELVYDPVGQDGSGNISVLGGTFAFISGQIAKTSPDAMKVTTPSATIGFRGTSGSGEVSDEGGTSIVLIRDPDGTVGEIVLVTPAGVYTLGDVLQGANISIDPTAPVVVQTISAAQFMQKYGTVTSQLPAARSDDGHFLDQATENNPIVSESENVTLTGQDINDIINDGGDVNTIKEALVNIINQQPPAPTAAPDSPIIDHTVTEETEETEEAIANSNLASGSHNGTSLDDTMGFASGANGAIYGHEGNDTLTANGSDSIYGNEGNDTLTVLSGTNYVHGNEGNDTIFLNAASVASNVHGGTGFDTLNLSLNDTGVGNTITDSGSSLTITIGSDTLATAEGIQTIVGSDYNDKLVVNNGDFETTFDGGQGVDTLKLSDYVVTETDGITVNTTTGVADAQNTSDDLHISFSNVEKFILTSGNDTFTGSDADETIAMGSGTDNIHAGDGDDVFLVDSQNTATTTLYGDGGENSIDLDNMSVAIAIDNSVLGSEGITGTDVSYSFSDVQNFYLSDDEDVTSANIDIIGCNIKSETFYGATRAADASISGGTGTGDSLSFGGNAHVSEGINVLGSAIDSNGDSTRSITFTEIETLVGSTYDDVFTNVEDVSIIQGGDGNDTFKQTASSIGTASYVGGDGNDTLDVGGLNSLWSVDINTSTGNMVVNHNDTGTSPNGIDGIERFILTSQDDTFIGSSADETITTNGGSDSINGGDGNDTIDISGTASPTTLNLDTHTITQDTGTINFQNVEGFVLGTGTNTVTEANTSDDIITVTGGTDNIKLSDGDDHLRVQGMNVASASTYVGGDGTDTLTLDVDKILGSSIDLTAGTETITVKNASMIMSNPLSHVESFERFNLSNGTDLFTSSSSDEVISMKDGNDILVYTSGNDTIDGGNGTDWLNINMNTSGHASIDVTAESLTLLNGSTVQNTSSITGFEAYRMTQNDDTFIGSDGDEYISGEGGSDILTGGNGADAFIFHTDSDPSPANLDTPENATAYFAELGIDTITDFTTGTDKIALDSNIFGTFDDGLTIVSDNDGNIDASYGVGAGIMMLQNGDDTELYYVSDLSQANINNYQFATLSDVTGLSASDIQSYADITELTG